jgi:hypothetical protein
MRVVPSPAPAVLCGCLSKMIQYISSTEQNGIRYPLLIHESSSPPSSQLRVTEQNAITLSPFPGTMNREIKRKRTDPQDPWRVLQSIVHVYALIIIAGIFAQDTAVVVI